MSLFNGFNVVLQSREEKIRMYKAAFDTFPSVAQKTARRLFGHLHFISTQNAKNKMTVDNLAAVWAPTLMHYEVNCLFIVYCCVLDPPSRRFICLFILEQERDNQQNLDPQKSGVVISQIIHLYRYIFPEDPTEIEQEKLMLQVLEKCMRSGQGAKNTNVSGDFRVWVYLYNKDGETFNVAVSGT